MLGLNIFYRDVTRNGRVLSSLAKSDNDRAATTATGHAAAAAATTSNRYGSGALHCYARLDQVLLLGPLAAKLEGIRCFRLHP